MASSSPPASTNENMVSSSVGSNSPEISDNGFDLATEPQQTGTSGVECPQHKLGSRITYSKPELLELKKSKLSQEEPDEKTILITSKVLLKVLKPECKILQRQSKPQDHGGIVLGPQKRGWNVGCHVSQSKRSPQDSSGQKNSKGFQESKFSRGDFKRDSKGSGRSNFNSSAGYSRGGKGDVSDRRRSTNSYPGSEKEPEWFTEGPESVNDTMELGGIIEENDCKERKSPKAAGTKAAVFNPSEVDSAIVSVEKSETPCASPKNSTISSEQSFMELFKTPKSANEGSRFSHLFKEKDQEPQPSANDSSASNTLSDTEPPPSKGKPMVLSKNLMGMLSCCGSPPAPVKPIPAASSSQPSANDLEFALRSLLLVGGSQKQGDSLSSVPKITEAASPIAIKPSAPAPTVEEIEAAAFRSGNSSFAAPMKPNLTKPFSTPQQNPSTAMLLEQLSRSWSSEQHGRPLSCNLESSSRGSAVGAPISLEALEAMQQRESAAKFSAGLSRPPGLEPQAPSRNMINWNEALLSASVAQSRNSSGSNNSTTASSLLNSILMAQLQQKRPQPPSMPAAPPGLLPTDPAIAFQSMSAQQQLRRPIVKASTPLMPDQQRFMPQQQPQYFNNSRGGLSPAFGGGNSGAGLPHGSNVEAALMQLKRSVAAANHHSHQQTTRGYHHPPTGPPPNSLFSPLATTSNAASSSPLEQLLLSSSARNVGAPTYQQQQPTIQRQQQSTMRQNTSAPNLLLPPRWQAAAAAEMLRSGNSTANSGNSPQHRPPGLTSAHRDG